MSRDERDARAHFADRYARQPPRVAREMETRVIGASWGANGFTTVGQADELGRRLHLGPGSRLLDVGTGRGWPGLYLAATSGCSLVATDMPLDALTQAARRSRREGMAERVDVVAAAAGSQPFRRRSFDAVVSTDVLC